MNVLVILPGFIPSTIIGVLRPLAELERRSEINLRVTLSNFSIFISSNIDWCDVAIFCRNCEVNDLQFLYELKRKGKKVVYEVDDNFEEIPLTTDIGMYHRSFFRLHVLKRFFSLSDVTRVYSERLLQRSVAHGARPQLIRSYFDKSIIDGCLKPLPDGIVRIAYPTGRIDDGELEERIFSATRMLLEKYSGKVEFHLWRKALPKQLLGVKGVVINKGMTNYDNFIRSFFQAGFDIGLAPGVDNPFFHSKTNNKYREFGGCGIAGVYSNFLPYSNSVIHEHSGLLAGSSTSEWVEAIERLILDANLRSRITKNAAEDVYSYYSFESSIESWRECFVKIQVDETCSPEWLPMPKLWPIYAVLHSGQDKTDRRYEHLISSCKGIHGSLLNRFDDAADYLKSSFRHLACASIFLVKDEDDLETVSQLIILSKSAIVDLSAFEGEVDVAISKIQVFASTVPTSYLVTLEQTKTSSLIQYLSDYVLTVKAQPLPIVHQFSLEGYPAAYLELLERHIHHAPVKMTSNRLARGLTRKFNNIADRYELWKGRIKTLTILIKLRLGVRRF